MPLIATRGAGFWKKETPGFEERSTDFGKIQTRFFEVWSADFLKIETVVDGIQVRNDGFEKFDAAIDGFWKTNSK